MENTIAHFLSSDIKVNQDFKYRQITNLQKYRSIVIGEFAHRNPDQKYPYEYFHIGDINDWSAFIQKLNIKAIHAHSGKNAVKILPMATLYKIPLIVSFRGNDASAQKEAFEKNRKEKDHKALANAIIKLLEDPKRSKSYTKQARKKVEKDFNLNKQIQVQEQYYDKFLGTST